MGGSGSLRLQSLREVEGGPRRQGPVLLPLMRLQEPVELLEVCDDVVFDVGDGDLQAHTSTVKRARAVA